MVDVERFLDVPLHRQDVFANVQDHLVDAHRLIAALMRLHFVIGTTVHLLRTRRVFRPPQLLWVRVVEIASGNALLDRGISYRGVVKETPLAIAVLQVFRAHKIAKRQRQHVLILPFAPRRQRQRLQLQLRLQPRLQQQRVSLYVVHRRVLWGITRHLRVGVAPSNATQVDAHPLVVNVREVLLTSVLTLRVLTLRAFRGRRAMEPVPNGMLLSRVVN